MPLVALASALQQRLIGSPLDVLFEVLDEDGDLTDAATITVTVTLPDGTTTTPAADKIDTGTYYARHYLTMAGRHTASVTTDGYGSAAFVATGVEITANADLPTVIDVDDYLKSGNREHSWTTDDLDDALTAEMAAQAKVCRIPAAYPADLRQALLRRCQRNLALRPNALGYVQSDGDVTFLRGTDAEIGRLERPWRKLPIG